MKSLTVIHRLIFLVLMLLTSMSFSQNKDNRIFDDTGLTISEISTNSVHSDFGPSIVQDSLYYTTFNENLFGKSDNKLKKKEYYDLYKVVVDKQGNVISGRKPVAEFTTHYNDGPVAWCARTGELFVTQNYQDQTVKLKPFQKEINHLRIMIARQVNGKWEQVSEFPYNNVSYSVGHPAITESGDTLIFSSDQPGGYGETDLYYSVRLHGEWQPPVNLGPKINTAAKEEFAFLTDQHFNGRYLIFATKGRSGNGNFDLYYTRFPSDYSEIVRFSSPLNSEYDDFAMTIPADAEYGYLTSNRPGTGSDDIYRFTFKRIIDQQKRFRELYAYDQVSRRPIRGASVVLCDKGEYQTDVKGAISGIPCSGNECEATASAMGYSDKSQLLAGCKMDSKEIPRDTIWMNILVNKKIILRNIYYDFDKWDILPESAAELDKLVALMKEKPEITLELSSHTDSRGSVIYNEKLSQRRAESAVSYVVSQGISRDRITGKGYGKSQLLNKCTEGIVCTPQEHRENRRTEIFIPAIGKGEYIPQEKGDYSNGRPDHTKGYSSRKEHGSITESGVKENKDNTRMRFFLTLATFKEQTDASALVEQLKVEGYEATISGESDPFTVGVSYRELSEAKKELEVLKTRFHDAWIQNK